MDCKRSEMMSFKGRWWALMMSFFFGRTQPRHSERYSKHFRTQRKSVCGIAKCRLPKICVCLSEVQD